MKRQPINIIIALLFLATGVFPVSAWQPVSPTASTAKQSRGGSSIAFIENAGQFDAGARFQVRGAAGAMWLVEDGLWITLVEREGGEGGGQGSVGAGGQEGDVDLTLRTLSPSPRQSVNVKISFPDANPHPRIEPFNRLDTVFNYYVGNDPANWHTNVPAWGGVRYKDICPGADLEITGQDGHFHWQLVPHRTPSPFQGEGWGEGLRLLIEGADSVNIDGHYLNLSTSLGQFSLPLLTTQGAASTASPAVQRTQPAAFEITAPFAPSQSLGHSPASPKDVPDSLLFGTYLGGLEDDLAADLAVDADGSAYVTGHTTSLDFPTKPGTSSLNGSMDAFVSKFDPTGSSLEYSVLVGGSYDEDFSFDMGRGIALDASGAAYVTGATNAEDFPTTPNAFDTTFDIDNTPCGLDPPFDSRCTDAFVFKLGSLGNLVYSTYLGGYSTVAPGGQEFGSDDWGNAIAVDGAGVAYVTGYTAAQDFPTTPGAFDREYAEVDWGLTEDIFVTVLNLASNGQSDLVYSTFVGGAWWDVGYDIAVDSAGHIYVTGYSGVEDGGNFPTTAGAYQPNLPIYTTGAVIFKLDPAGNGGNDLLYSSFLGSSSGSTYGQGLTLGQNNAVYLTGETLASDFPTTPGAFMETSPGGWIPNTAFVSKMALNGNGAADLVYSTYLGGNSFDEGRAITVGGDEKIYVTGETYSSDFPTTANAFDTSKNGTNDVFIARLDPAGNGATDLEYGTYVGSGTGAGIAIGPAGVIFVAGKTASGSFPTTEGAFDTTFTWNTCSDGLGNDYTCPDAFVVKLKIVNPTTSDVDTWITAPPLVGAPPGGAAVIPIQYGNNGATTATSVMITATLGISLTYAGDTSGITPTVITGTNTTLVWSLLDLGFLDAGGFNLQAVIPADPLGTRYPVTLEIASAGPEALPANNAADLEVMAARQVFLPIVYRGMP